MTAKRFHLGWFTNFTADEWLGPFSNGGAPWDGKFYVEMAQSLERACFDYIMLEDKLAISRILRRDRRNHLEARPRIAPKHDPVPLATMISASTRNLGVVATMSTLAYPPFMLARLASTVDSIAGGRFGWNIVTSAKTPPRRTSGSMPFRRASSATTWRKNIWTFATSSGTRGEPDAVIRDRATSTYADYKKVHTINFEGKFFKCRGPLNTVRSPQGVPALVQAGGSPKGRSFAAKHANSIVAVAPGIEKMKEFRDDVRARAKAHGRNPDDIKILFLVAPVLAETEEEAWAKNKRKSSDPMFLEQCLALISAITDIDFKKYELDKPLPGKLTTNGEQGSLDMFQQWGSNKTLRQLVVEASGGIVGSVELVGTPEQVADKMAETMAAVGGDGFLITTPVQSTNRRTVIEVCDGLVPVLQRKGLVRTEYTGKTLKENLVAF